MSDEILDRLSAALEDTYDVEGALGEGGMALVYLARDIKHDRQVAIKVLKPDLAASLGAERFLREIRITAKLQHPHILPLYDSGEADGLLYYVMPFVEGESLADMIEREKQLSSDEAMTITKEVAGALGHAHAYGLIHRDIKPDNVMLTGGHAIVADFGIAKAVSDAGGSGVTSTGTSIGTPAYMSPEQGAGDPNVDARTDIYALGCMLYEMLIGQPPFTGPNAVAIMARHTMDQVPPPSIMRQSIMPELEDVIFCAMAKTPADRFRTAQEMVEAISAIESGGAPKVRTTRATSRISMPVVEQSPWKRAIVPVLSTVAVVAVGIATWQLFFSGGPAAPVDTGLNLSRVAVLYFEDVTPGEDLSYVADGITEGLIDRLQAVPALTVISRSGVEPFRDPSIPRDSIGGALEVGSIVAGSVARSGDQLEVSANLYDGFSGQRVDGASLRLPAADLLAAQDSVVEAVSLFLRERIGEEFRASEQRSSTTSDDAWRLVQRAERRRKDANQQAGDDTEAALRTLQEADSLFVLAAAADPDWVDPVIGRGWVAYRRAQLQDGAVAVQGLEEAVGHADEILADFPRDARALELRGTARFGLYQAEVDPDPDAQGRLVEGARADLEAAVEADPSLASAYITLSYVYYAPEFDDVPAALGAARRGYDADAYLENADETIYRLFWGNIDNQALREARRWCNVGGQRFPDAWWTVDCQLWIMVTPEVQDPSIDEAWQLRARFDSLTESRFRRARADYLVGGVIAKSGAVDSARSVFDRTRQLINPEFDPDLELYAVEAYVRTLSDDVDIAIDLLKQFQTANPEHDFSEQLGTWWWIDVRNHPRRGELGVG
jgi:serine/threonine-protein kinase